jgi:hypothetical protein
MVKPRADRDRKLVRRGSAGRSGQPSEAIDHPLETREHATTFVAFADVALEPLAQALGEVTIDVRRHLARRPLVIAHEARAWGILAHLI